jgi:murein L,D-transpeptidase YcbB/YkuD
VLDGAAAAPDLALYLAALAPRTTGYARLRNALARYRARAERRDWPTVSPGPPLQLGMSDRRVVELRRAIAAHGDGTGETAGDPEVFDLDLESAVGRFQVRHGLAADGVFGPATRAAFNVPVETRIAQFVLNMERRRWMPDDLGRRHVLVNLADFTLEYVDGARTAFGTRVIVGTPYQRSPLFSATMTGFELNPYWHVTDNIARTEMLPAIRREIGYLADNDLQVLSFRDGRAYVVDPESVPWSALGPDRFPYLLRQEPGPRNALGRIKFLMPNGWDVYLHDTPAQELFERSVRSFSRGCIRVQNPFDFAAALLGPDGPTTGALEERALNGERVSIQLPAPVPVHLAYVTAWVDEDGRVHFRRDIYGRDRRLADALGLGAVVE